MLLFGMLGNSQFSQVKSLNCAACLAAILAGVGWLGVFDLGKLGKNLLTTDFVCEWHSLKNCNNKNQRQHLLKQDMQGGVIHSAILCRIIPV